ncbi:Starvation-inducible DNA-binding protein, ferritin-like protein [Alteracholeplasma palmae J233]|uniref:Starvation-inducible DNA-binding protein, ferritin-like protein n=1 Tax=Alteracholeplasma palmae (strain ATCC 49389 / J233) TaxID=1318466 RepID=U4KLJ6_ALTPJ|nr:DNA starvation/stationary phase protection protein [Alteracholeplasma palmae]CCV64829.1 Starvation-inducible DNA-binding protein, ferritin-like protein [Alteracholeplasma palmae J233]
MNKLYVALNKQVSNFSVLFTKLHHYHWYVKGPEFFSLHEHLEELYNEVNELYDEYAERLIAIGGKPISNLKGYLEVTSLNEATEESTKDMILAVSNDLKLLVTELKEVIDLADKVDDYGTADMATSTIRSFDKHIWMFTALLNK